MRKNILVVVYSYTGTSLDVANLLGSQQSWPIGFIEDENPRAGVIGHLRSLADSMFRRRPPIRYKGPSLSDFDAIVLVSPIWAWQLAGPMRTFVTDLPRQPPDIAVVSVMGSRGAAYALAEIEEIVGFPPVMSIAISAHEIHDGSYAGKLKAFGSAIQNAEDSEDVIRPMTLSPETL